MKKAFTLVELIVVVLILSVLSTIAFLSYVSYWLSARDAKRVSDISELHSKIVLKNSLWTSLDSLIDSNSVYNLQVMWDINPVKTFWVINFDNLKENRANFKDPHYEQDYLAAFTISKNPKNPYKFIQLASINEEEETTVIRWNYKTKEDDDIPSLFYDWIYYKDSEEPMIYGGGRENLPETPTCLELEEAWFFDFDASTWTITWYSHDWPKDVIIPCKIWWVDVVSILDYSFKEKEIKSVIFSWNNLKYIWNLAFANNLLENLELPNSLENLWEDVFGDNKIKDLKIWDKLELIKRFTFTNNPLENIKIWKNIKIIEMGAFTIGNHFWNTKGIEYLEIPDNVESIWEYAFNWLEIRNLKLWNKLLDIWYNAFGGNNITNLKIPWNVKNIWESAFANSNIEVLEFEEWIENTWSNSFASNKLKVIKLANTINIIWHDCFAFQKIPNDLENPWIFSWEQKIYWSKKLKDDFFARLVFVDENWYENWELNWAYFDYKYSIDSWILTD